MMLLAICASRDIFPGRSMTPASKFGRGSTSSGRECTVWYARVAAALAERQLSYITSQTSRRRMRVLLSRPVFIRHGDGRLAQVGAELDAIGADAAEGTVRKILTGLGFTDEMQVCSVSSSSPPPPLPPPRSNVPFSAFEPRSAFVVCCVPLEG